MKILKIFGIVVGIHVFALILIFANPGCSSTSKPSPSTADTAPAPEASPVVSAPSAAPGAYTASTGTSSSSAITFNPDAPAAAAPTSGSGVRFSPTRPNSAAAGTLVAEPVTDVTPAAPYTVKSGDNLWSIAKKHNITVAQLTAANNLAASASLRPGQKLIIPVKSSASTAATKETSAAGAMSKSAESGASSAAPHSSAEGVKHTVKSGETLGAIARKYGVRQGDIAVANNISDPAKIRPGMELIIPGWQATGAKSSGKSGKKSSGSTAKSAAPESAPAKAETPAAAPAPAAAEPAATTPPPVPVIRIDDTPVTPPAPKP